jgi:hypothetical protein
MTLTLELTPEEATQLKEDAARAGLDEATYARRRILGRRDVTPPQITPAELLAGWQAQGLLAGFGDPTKDSPNVARELREELSRRDG